MALKVGKTDAFERKYMGSFRQMAAQFGEFVEYERDRAGRDIGLHFVETRKEGGEIVTPALVWFQMKGIMSETLSKADLEGEKHAKIDLPVTHLRFWYIAPEETFLALYVEALDKFLVLNLKRYVTENFGDEILTLDQGTKRIEVPLSSVLDHQAFYLIRRNQSISAWKDRIQEGDDYAHVFFRDANLIARLAEIERAGDSATIRVIKYGSKMRTEVYFLHHAEGENEPDEIRSHWQFAMGDDLRAPFPYLAFDLPEEDWFDDEDDWGTGHPPITLPNGKQVIPEGQFEMVEYVIQIELNEIGRAWHETLLIMEKTGFIEIDLEDEGGVSVAPWHGREV